MNQKKVILVAFSVAILVLFSASISFSEPALWPKKQGELCWEADSGGILHLYIMKMGTSNHYFVSGYSEEGDGEMAFINGTAIVFDDKIVIHASSSGYSGDADDPTEIRGTLGTVILEDPDTLDGTYRGVNINWWEANENPAEPKGSVKYDGVQTMTFIPCPDPDELD